MADTYQHIDLTTLQRVEQLLTTADLGPGDERGGRTSVPASASVGVGAAADASVVPGEGHAPLPRRR